MASPATVAHQRIVVMRHGDRIDHMDPLWPATAARPWDPQLTAEGLVRAWNVGKRIAALGFPIHRIFVSPFLRCLQTASETAKALAAVGDRAALESKLSSDGVSIDPSAVKISIEYGLCEMLNNAAMGSKIVPPVDKKWFPDIAELEAVLPAGTIDHTVERIYLEMPEWGESVLDTRNRYANVIRALADKYPKDNLLLVTHGEAVGVSVSYFRKDVEIYEVEYCAYSILERNITMKPDEEFAAEEFSVVMQNTQTGLRYTISSGAA